MFYQLGCRSTNSHCYDFLIIHFLCILIFLNIMFHEESSQLYNALMNVYKFQLPCVDLLLWLFSVDSNMFVVMYCYFDEARTSDWSNLSERSLFTRTACGSSLSFDCLTPRGRHCSYARFSIYSLLLACLALRGGHCSIVSNLLT